VMVLPRPPWPEKDHGRSDLQHRAKPAGPGQVHWPRESPLRRLQ
ncbi:hypothetical protein LCGC14_2989310, partial [marine sediment metagenome]